MDIVAVSEEVGLLKGYHMHAFYTENAASFKCIDGGADPQTLSQITQATATLTNLIAIDENRKAKIHILGHIHTPTTPKEKLQTTGRISAYSI